MDFGSIMKFKQAWNTFTQNHPKFPAFMDAVKMRGVHADDIVTLSIKGPDGRVLETNIKVSASDLELFETLRGLN